MSNIRCKFKVESVTETKAIGCVSKCAVLTPVISNDPDSENGKFWQYTPVGRLELQVTNNSLDGLEPGAEYYIDLTVVNE